MFLASNREINHIFLHKNMKLRFTVIFPFSIYNTKKRSCRKNVLEDKKLLLIIIS